VDADITPAREPLSVLDRALRLFTDVRSGEGLTGIVMFADVFLILCAYYFVKALRDGWIAVSEVAGLSQVELKAYASFAQALLLSGVVATYARLSARWPRRTLITRVTLFCISNLVLFWLLQPGFLFTNVSGAGVVFYLWVGMFGVFVVAQFWTFAADLYAGERGKRLLPLIAVGATGGAAFGSFLTQHLLRSGLVDSGTLLLMAIVPLAGSILLTRLADTRGPVGGMRIERTARSAPAVSAPPTGSGALDLILRHRYLLAVATVATLTNWVNTNGENLLFRVLQETLRDDLAARGITGTVAVRAFVREGTTAFYGNYFFWVNLCALLAQALLASRLLRYGGIGAVLLLLPIISLVSYSTMAVLPVLGVVHGMKIAENATNYSIDNTARQVIWLPTTTEMKYWTKPAIDSLFLRLGDGMAALTILVGLQLLHLPTRNLALVNVALTGCWLGAAVVIVLEYRRLMEARTPPAPIA
jgi:ATP:ADP antiporter, AAA family